MHIKIDILESKNLDKIHFVDAVIFVLKRIGKVDSFSIAKYFSSRSVELCVNIPPPAPLLTT